MAAGDRDQRVAIYSDSGGTVNSVGQHVPSVSLVGTYWAQVSGSGGKDLMRAQQEQVNATHVVKMLADSTTRAIKPLRDYFSWRSKRLNIISAQQQGYRELEIEFVCEELVSGV